jgi:hypothetical protein
MYPGHMRTMGAISFMRSRDLSCSMSTSRSDGQRVEDNEWARSPSHQQSPFSPDVRRVDDDWVG